MTAFAEKHYPEVLLPEELDAYLDRGWYRMGQTIFTTHFLCFGEQFYSAIWVRLQLQGHQFTKSQRKLLRRNGHRFKVEVKPAGLDREKELLFQRYKKQFSGILAPSLRESLLDGEDYNVFNTLEIQIRDEDKLVGLSFFDLGQHSAASIMGIYDPDYDRYSLGYYSMLLEIYFCLQQGLQLYYPGYIVPGYQRFDYKLRIGEVDFLDLHTLAWYPYGDLQPQRIPIEQMRLKLDSLHTQLEQAGYTTKLLHYPLFEANLFGFWNAPYLDYPVLIRCQPKTVAHEGFFVVVFDIREQAYLLMRCAPFDDLQFYFNDAYAGSFNRDLYFMELTVVEKVILRSTDAAEMAEAVVQHLGSLSV